MVVLIQRFGLRRDAAGIVAGIAIFSLRAAALLEAWRLPHLR